MAAPEQRPPVVTLPGASCRAGADRRRYAVDCRSLLWGWTPTFAVGLAPLVFLPPPRTEATAANSRAPTPASTPVLDPPAANIPTCCQNLLTSATADIQAQSAGPCKQIAAVSRYLMLLILAQNHS